MKSPHPTTCRGVLPMCVRAQSCLTLCDSTDCGPPGSSVRGISQARILEWVAIFSSRGIFPTQGSNPHLLHLLHWHMDSLLLRHLGSLWLPCLLLLLLLSHFSRVRLCATPWTASSPGSPVLGFSRQEHWRGLPFPRVSQSGKAPDTSSVGVV